MSLAKSLLPIAYACFLLQSALWGQEKEERIESKVETSSNGDVFLIQELTLKAPVEKVWDAYTTTKGWQAWVAPVSSVDLKIGGLIKSNYRKDGKLTDDDAITIHVINYVPNRVLTLKSELGENFPAVLKEQEERMYNVITFEPKGEKETKLVSYGIGYKDSPELKRMLKFFVQANEQSYAKLIEYVESK